MANRMQACAIERFHRHLERLGRVQTLDETARLWVAKFARLWREHYTSRAS